MEGNQEKCSTPVMEEHRESYLPSLIPHVGMEFRNSDEAWAFWLSYGGQRGFEVRKRYTNKRPSDGTITSCRFVCANEGHRAQDKRDHLIKCPRSKTRTDCQVHMSLIMDRGKGILKVTELVLEHNHVLHLPETLHLLVSQRKISDLQAFEIETADDAGIGPKAAHELASRQVGGEINLSYTIRDHKNYLRTKRQREMAYGIAGSMLNYFQDKIAENPSFQYALQMDCEEKIASIFWADARMVLDYAHFGDVVSFDTTFGTNNESRPFGVFVGFNHFRETVIFGAALMYDETFESFKWLFETFLKAHNGQQPKTVYTDQDAAMMKAVGQVFVEAWHELCTFHIMQNAIKHLHEEKNDGKNEGKKNGKKKEVNEEKNKGKKKEKIEEPNILSDFSACMFQYEEITEFEQYFDLMRKKVPKQTWLDSIYKLKEKWAACYMKGVFTLGMRSTQLSESLNNDLKINFKSDLDLIRFFKHFERVVQGKRNTELNSEFDSRKKQPRIFMRRPPAMLVQASKKYTPIIFEAFQGEYERSLQACAKAMDGNNEYLVGDFTYEEGYKVIGDPLKQTVICDCQQFDRVGILCCHALKVLDIMNIKLLPPQYMLKRWTREARAGTVQDNQGRNIVESPKMDAMLGFKFMSNKFLNLAHRAAHYPECIMLVDSTLDILGKQIEEKINACTSTLEDPCIVPTNANPPNELLSNARLKKKEVKTTSSKRIKSWIDKEHKARKKRQKPKDVEESSNGGAEGQGQGPKTNDKVNSFEDNMGLISWSQLLTGPNTDDILTRDLF